jgi:anion exchange protein
LRTIDEFLNCCVVIPPGEWDRQILLQTIPVLESQSQKMFQIRRRKDSAVAQEDIDKVQGPVEDSLERTGRFCGGLVRDIKRRFSNYISDFTDAFDIHCLAAIVFVYIASLAPAITFGGILSEKTGGWIGVSETILATGLAGIIFALLAGQPLTIISFTGPLVVFEKSTYELSENLNIEYLPFRAWIGIWVMFICFVIVAFEGCFLVRYFTRFTEEIFACLIAFTFIYDAIVIVIDEYDSPVTTNTTISNITTTTTTNSSASGHLALLLVLGTFIISYLFRRFRHSHFFDHLIRRIVSDFGVLIAILSMVAYYNLDDDTSVSQLVVPGGFDKTKTERIGWLVNPMGTGNSMDVLSIISAIIPAVFVSILIFMEVELTGLILDKKEFKLKKGTGYNLDLIVVGLIVCLCSLLGFPWLCASPIHSVSHLHALMVFNNDQAPGERPVLVEVKEQRVTNIVIHILIGLSAFLAPALRAVPIPVLAGVLLYLGVCSLSHIQLCERVKMLFMRPNHHPDVSYVLKVTTKKMHVFTIIQSICVCIIILIKQTMLAPTFPFFVLCLIPLRKSLVYWYDEQELELLDNEAEELNEDEYDEFDAVHVPI